MHTEFEQIAIYRMDIECIIIPSYHLLRELDRNSAYKDTAAFHSEVVLRSERYYDLVVKPQEFAHLSGEPTFQEKETVHRSREFAHCFKRTHLSGEGDSSSFLEPVRNGG